MIIPAGVAHERYASPGSCCVHLIPPKGCFAKCPQLLHNDNAAAVLLLQPALLAWGTGDYKLAKHYVVTPLIAAILLCANHACNPHDVISCHSAEVS